MLSHRKARQSEKKDRDRAELSVLVRRAEKKRRYPPGSYGDVLQFVTGEYTMSAIRWSDGTNHPTQATIKCRSFDHGIGTKRLRWDINVP